MKLLKATIYPFRRFRNQYQQIQDIDSKEPIFKIPPTPPQYDWTTNEVRAWMADHFVTNMSRETSYAITVARQYEGTGKQLFSNTKEDWLEVFERKAYGREMYETMAWILRNDEELRKTGFSLQLLPFYYHKEIVELIEDSLNRRKTVRRPLLFIKDLGTNGHVYLLFFLEISLTLFVSKHTSIEFSNYYFFLYALLIPHYGSVQLSNYLKYKEEIKELSNKIRDKYKRE
ncbi:81a17f24-04b6-4425-b1fe-5e9cbe7413c6 [Sclerotinia trifoliorum]|uniref:81a17f24-04b6-4425-b1fe-5e9cbe7413c6 n=1 Tax=Sclerotinia trifoliorum TaxID=28548 RepID=A0A8H2ZTK4_9HELO|nr:81a17f24-04b6-4425-b1fe-5e9cbe7413c6 [Sclerotinia trifoliorum]